MTVSLLELRDIEPFLDVFQCLFILVGQCLFSFAQREDLKGLGHAILGNFSTDRMVIDLTKISK